MKYFSNKELKCRCGACGCKGEINNYLAIWLDKIREAVKKPVKVTSGLRCPKHNAKEGGSRTSKHITGHAADIKVADLEPSLLALIARGCAPRNRRLGIGIYKSWIHVDIDARTKDYYWVK